MGTSEGSDDPGTIMALARSGHGHELAIITHVSGVRFGARLIAWDTDLFVLDVLGSQPKQGLGLVWIPTRAITGVVFCTEPPARAASKGLTWPLDLQSDCETTTSHAVGATPEDAIRALCLAKGWGEMADASDLEDLSGLARAQGTGYTWGRRFTAGGMALKAAGMAVPGGVLLTWWK